MIKVKQRLKHERMRLGAFLDLFELYAKHHSPIYSARIAYGIVYNGLPF